MYSAYSILYTHIDTVYKLTAAAAAGVNVYYYYYYVYGTRAWPQYNVIWIQI